MIIDGIKVSNEIHMELKKEIAAFHPHKPGLAVVLIGQHPPSEIYVKRKIKACEEVGIHSELVRLPESVSEVELLQKIHQLNQNPQIDGILVQLPLPKHLDPNKISYAIDPHKDVDGIHPINFGKLLLGEKDGFTPCTPLGIKTLLKYYQVDLTGKKAVVLGRSNIVGKPMAAILMQNDMNATVTVLNSYSQNIANICSEADLIVAAIGKPHFIKKSMVKKDAVIIDVGINRTAANNLKGYSIVGDVDFEDVKNHCALITPVPGGIGPMTIAMLLSNTLKSYKMRHFV